MVHFPEKGNIMLELYSISQTKLAFLLNVFVSVIKWLCFIDAIPTTFSKHKENAHGTLMEINTI